MQKTANGEHQYGPWEVIQDTTCVDDGLRVHYCEFCGWAENEIFPRLTNTTGEIGYMTAKIRLLARRAVRKSVTV